MNSTLHRVTTVLRVAIGLTLVYAGSAKLRTPLEFLAAVYDYRIIGPPMGAMVAGILPFLEIMAGILLIIGIAVEASLCCACLLGVTFTLAQIAVIARHLTVHCNCFGSSSSSIVGAATFVRASAFLAISAIVLVLERSKSLIDMSDSRARRPRIAHDPLSLMALSGKARREFVDTNHVEPVDGASVIVSRSDVPRPAASLTST